MIDHWGAIITIFESGGFAELSYSNSRVTINNKLSVALSYMAISSLS